MPIIVIYLFTFIYFASNDSPEEIMPVKTQQTNPIASNTYQQNIDGNATSSHAGVLHPSEHHNDLTTLANTNALHYIALRLHYIPFTLHYITFDYIALYHSGIQLTFGAAIFLHLSLPGADSL